MNFVGSGRSLTMIPEHVFLVASQTGVSTFELDLCSGEIASATFRTKALIAAAGVYRRFFKDQVESQGSSLALIASATLRIHFQLGATRQSRFGGTIPKLECEVRIRDDRGIEHIGRPANWWHD